MSHIFKNENGYRDIVFTDPPANFHKKALKRYPRGYKWYLHNRDYVNFMLMPECEKENLEKFLIENPWYAPLEVPEWIKPEEEKPHVETN